MLYLSICTNKRHRLINWYKWTFLSLYITICLDICNALTNTIIYIYIYIYIYKEPSICFQIFLVQAFNVVADSWKFSILLLHFLWDDWPNFMILGLNEQLQQELDFNLLKPDCHSWWISKMQSGRRNDTLKEWYAIKFCFKLGKNVTETYGMLKTALGAWIKHQF